MNPGTKLLAAVLALVAAAPAANAQSPGGSYGRRPVSRVPYTTPYLAHRRPAPFRRVWIPGHREHVQRRVWVDDEPERQWIPPVYETRLDGCGRTVRVLVREGSWVVVHRPGHFETCWVEVWVGGHWKTVR